jgi:hypothetical protein
MITYTFKVSYPREMTAAESEAIAAAMVAEARRLAEAPPAEPSPPPIVATASALAAETMRRRLEATARREALLAADGRDHSARAVLARMPVIHDPVISAAMASLDDDDPDPPSEARPYLISTLIGMILLLLWLVFSIPALATLPALWGGW